MEDSKDLLIMPVLFPDGRVRWQKMPYLQKETKIPNPDYQHLELSRCRQGHGYRSLGNVFVPEFLKMVCAWHKHTKGYDLSRKYWHPEEKVPTALELEQLDIILDFKRLCRFRGIFPMAPETEEWKKENRLHWEKVRAMPWLQKPSP